MTDGVGVGDAGRRARSLGNGDCGPGKCGRNRERLANAARRVMISFPKCKKETPPAVKLLRLEMIEFQ
jgi:hypothetical protein